MTLKEINQKLENLVKEGKENTEEFLEFSKLAILLCMTYNPQF